jgi:hypothetical protein
MMDSSSNVLSSSNEIIDISNNVSENEVIDTNKINKNKEAFEKYKKLQEEYLNNRKKELTLVVCRQTDYTESEAREKLEKNNFVVQDVINEYLGIEKKTTINNKSANQIIYNEIRDLMDTGARTFRKNQEQAKAYQKWLESRNKSN